MAEYTKKLHYLRNGATQDIQLYTSLSDVVDANDTTPSLRLKDGNTTVYAALELLTSSNTSESGLKVSSNGKNYVVLGVSPSSAVGIALVALGGGSGTWARIDAFGDAVQ